MAKMIKKIKYSHKDRGPNYEINMQIDMDRFDQQFNEAQYLLDSMVMDSMVRFMPMQTGTFINVTREMSAAIAGTGMVYAAAPPMGRFLYEGYVMVDPVTLSPFARKDVKKVLTNRKLVINSHAHPNAQDHWFDAAKAADGERWVRKAKRKAGGGK